MLLCLPARNLPHRPPTSVGYKGGQQWRGDRFAGGLQAHRPRFPQEQTNLTPWSGTTLAAKGSSRRLRAAREQCRWWRPMVFVLAGPTCRPQGQCSLCEERVKPRFGEADE